ncbi:hypothetical protein FOA52_000288 [Chlamydomonas sp. UWO 241]|nr:hypothetical protein FOA52_000288 [Chlamydomonas sp. UWO 241]
MCAGRTEERPPPLTAVRASAPTQCAKAASARLRTCPHGNDHHVFVRRGSSMTEPESSGTHSLEDWCMPELAGSHTTWQQVLPGSPLECFGCFRVTGPTTLVKAAGWWLPPLTNVALAGNALEARLHAEAKVELYDPEGDIVIEGANASPGSRSCVCVGHNVELTGRFAFAPDSPTCDGAHTHAHHGSVVLNVTALEEVRGRAAFVAFDLLAGLVPAVSKFLLEVFNRAFGRQGWIVNSSSQQRVCRGAARAGACAGVVGVVVKRGTTIELERGHDHQAGAWCGAVAPG